MGFFDRFNKQSGGYIFISHSHKDIDTIRGIRNDLEKEGFEPLCFYLKCLDDDSEIEDLIKREIDAREWFLFTDSKNARESRWVRMERDYICQTDDKKIISVELSDEEAVRHAVRQIKQSLRFYFAHSRADAATVQRIKDRMTKKDYLVYSDEDLKCGDAWADTIGRMIREAAEEGCVLLLLSEASVRSHYVIDELRYAAEMHSRLFPIVLGKIPDMPDDMRYLIGDLQYFMLPEDPTDEQLDGMIDRIGRVLLRLRY